MPIDLLTNKKYPSKLLLFGEYGVLYGYKALAIPFSNYSANWIVQNTLSIDSVLLKFADYLNGINQKLEIPLAIEELKKDVENGLKFHSTIPQNYGLGSSGALAAAVFDRYRKDAPEFDVYLKDLLKNELALMESFFHGKSSGTDPLVSLLQKPVLIENETFRTIEPSSFTLATTNLFIVDSQVQGRTAGLVQSFLQKMNEQNFSPSFKNAYKTFSDTAIDHLLENNIPLFYNSFANLSNFQLNAMNELIPAHIQDYFRIGLNSGKFSLKICGSGGGGFFLGSYRDKKFIEQVFHHPVYFI